LKSKKQSQFEYKRSDKGKTATKKYQQGKAGKAARQKYKLKYPERIRAVNTSNRAIKNNIIKREPCEFCGISYNIEGHHHNYNQPLNVMWLCKTCHKILHSVYRR